MDATAEQLNNLYRPRKLAEFVGNEVAVNTIRGMLQTNRIPQVFLLEGQVGCGKTSMGRFLATRLNCTGVKPGDVDPCGECDSCMGMNQNVPSNACYTEINASDARKLDDIRSLIKQARFLPSGAKYRIFLLDEPQGIIKDAQQALLKPLEDTPPNVIWIFCTTDPGKLLEAIRSRARAGHIVMRRVDHVKMAKHLHNIAKKEGAKVPKDALIRMAEMTDGHPRDSIGVLSSFMALSHSGEFDTEEALIQAVEEAAATSPYQASMSMLEAVFAGNVAQAIHTAKRVEAPAEITMSFMTKHWLQCVYRAVDNSLVDKSHGWWFGKMKTKPPKNVVALVRGGDILNKALARAKEHVEDDMLLMVNTILAVHHELSNV